MCIDVGKGGFGFGGDGWGGIVFGDLGGVDIEGEGFVGIGIEKDGSWGWFLFDVLLKLELSLFFVGFYFFYGFFFGNLLGFL